MKFRPLFLLVATTAMMLSVVPPAAASVGPPQLQRLAIAQTQSLFKNYFGSILGRSQTASPPTCLQAESQDGVFLLPTLSFSPGDRQFFCLIHTQSVFLDLGGSTVTEDARGDTYPLNGQDVLFTKENLAAICDDALANIFPLPAPASVDSHPITGATAVSTPTFKVKINRRADSGGQPFYQDSVDLGHPGILTSCFTGWKAIVPLPAGGHIISVDLTGLFQKGSPSTRFTYYIYVSRH